MFLAQGYSELGDDAQALDWIRRVRRMDRDNWRAIALEARIHHKARRFQEAADRAVNSLALVYLQPALHHLLGTALIVVTGLPRSGTSMMMQILAAAGIRPHTDNQRAADPDNRRGYYEHGAAMRLHRHTSWLPEARGKAVKIVAPLLLYLPPGEQYRLIFMHRALDEVVASQRAMLQRLGRSGGNINDTDLARAFTSQLVRIQNWLERRSEIPVLAVGYAFLDR